MSAVQIIQNNPHARCSSPRLESAGLTLQLNSLFSYSPKEKGDRKKKVENRTTHQILSTGMPAYPLWPHRFAVVSPAGEAGEGQAPSNPFSMPAWMP